MFLLRVLFLLTLLFLLGLIFLLKAVQRFKNPYDSWGRWLFTLLSFLFLGSGLAVGGYYFLSPPLEGGQILSLERKEDLKNLEVVDLELPKFIPSLKEKISLEVCRALSSSIRKDLKCGILGKMDPPYLHLFVECNFLGICSGILSLRYYDPQNGRIEEKPIGRLNFRL